MEDCVKKKRKKGIVRENEEGLFCNRKESERKWLGIKSCFQESHEVRRFIKEEIG